MQQLQTIDADTLMSTPLPVTQFIVEGLLPEGLHILAGSPKIGKSWLALWICLRVSKGAPVWDLPTMRGTVLYSRSVIICSQMNTESRCIRIPSQNICGNSMTRMVSPRNIISIPYATISSPLCSTTAWTNRQ